MSLPPGPNTPRPIQILRWIRKPFDVLDRCSARYGDIFTLRMPGAYGQIVVVGDPESVKEVFALGPDDAHAGKANLVLKPFLGRHSLLLLDGAEHLRQRKMMLPAFHGERMQAYGRAMLDLAHDSIDGWPVGKRFAAHRPMQKITLEVILRTVFGVDAGPRFRELADVVARNRRSGAEAHARTLVRGS